MKKFRKLSDGFHLIVTVVGFVLLLAIVTKLMSGYWFGIMPENIVKANHAEMIAAEALHDKQYNYASFRYQEVYQNDTTRLDIAYRIASLNLHDLDNFRIALKYLKIVNDRKYTLDSIVFVENDTNRLDTCLLFNRLTLAYMGAGHEWKEESDDVDYTKYLDTALIYGAKSLALRRDLFYTYNNIGRTYYEYADIVNEKFINVTNIDSLKKAVVYFDSAYMLEPDEVIILNKARAYDLLKLAYGVTDIEFKRGVRDEGKEELYDYYTDKAYECYKLIPNNERAKLGIELYEIRKQWRKEK